jgi:cell division protein FtsQ
MFSTFKSIRTWLLTAGGLFSLFGLIAFTEIRHGQKHVRDVIVRLNQADGEHFLTNRDVMAYLTRDGNDPILGKAYTDVNFRQLETRLRQHGLVKTCQVSRALNGDLIVGVEPPRPLARLVSLPDDETQRVSGQYVSEEGRFFPVSMNYTARVPLLSGAYFASNRSLASERNRPLLNLLKRIQQDSFWRAQIVELSVDRAGEVTMWPQLGQQQLELGEPVNLDVKFQKLKLFYTNILPAKGWDAYHRVNVQYRNQIVCE